MAKERNRQRARFEADLKDEEKGGISHRSGVLPEREILIRNRAVGGESSSDSEDEGGRRHRPMDDEGACFPCVNVFHTALIFHCT